MKPSSFATAARAALVIMLYCAGGVLGRKASFVESDVVLVWPPAGIALAAVLLFGPRIWWGVAVGSLLFSLVQTNALGVFALGVAVGNTIGALVCAYLLERLLGFKNSLDRVRDVAGFVLLASVLGTTVNAGTNAVSVVYGGEREWEMLPSILMQWWVANAMSVLVVTPLLLSWCIRSRLSFSFKDAIEAAICAAGLVFGTLVSFQSWYVSGIQNYPFAYLPYPFLVWGALRFGMRGATIGTLAISTMAIHSLLEGRGPFVTSNERDSLMLIGSYITVLAVTNLLLAAAASERSQAQGQLAESEKRYRAVVEDQSDLICRFSPAGRLTFVNDAYCRFYERPRSGLLGTSFMPLLSEEDREIPLAMFAHLHPGEPAVSFDDKVRLPSGEVVWMQCSTRALFDSGGTLIEYQMVVQDVTARKRSEESARVSADRLEAIVNSMVDGVVVLDGNTAAVVSFNPAAESIFGLKPGEVIGRAAGSLFSEDRALFDDYLARQVCKGRGTVVETSVIRPGGERVPVDIVASNVRLSQMPLIVLVVRDISERKKAQENLREREEFFRLISESMTDMITVLDGGGRQVYASPSYGRLLGVSAPGEAANALEHIHPEDRERIRAMFQQMLASGAALRSEHRLLLRDGAIRFVETQGSVVRGGKGEQTAVLVSRDVTDRINLEAQLRQSQKMEAVGRLAGGIAHDFNNLMQAIIGYTDLLLRRLPPEAADHDTVAQIEKSADRAAALTRQLLAFSRKQVLKPELISLNRIVTEVDKLLRRLIGENIQLRIETGSGTGSIRADPGQIEQVILNLAINARDAMSGSGTLTIETEDVEIESALPGFSPEFHPGEYVRLTVSDTGSGMTPEVLAHLFEPFFTTKESGKGTGLGLSIVYGIVRQSGGEIRVRTRLGHGTSFEVYLPRIEQSELKEEKAAPDARRLRGTETILLVEDGEIVRAMLVEVLRAQGYTVLEAENGEEALKAASGHGGKIDILVTDMLMPNMSGWELAERLSASRSQMPVLYISGYSEHEALHHAEGVENVDYLQKPFRPETLLLRIRQILDGSGGTG